MPNLKPIGHIAGIVFAFTFTTNSFAAGEQASRRQSSGFLRDVDARRDRDDPVPSAPSGQGPVLVLS